MALPGLMLMADVIASLGLLTGSKVQWFAIWTLYAVAALATKSTVWRIAISTFLIMTVTIALVVHQIPIPVRPESVAAGLPRTRVWQGCSGSRASW